MLIRHPLLVGGPPTLWRGGALLVCLWSLFLLVGGWLGLCVLGVCGLPPPLRGMVHTQVLF